MRHIKTEFTYTSRSFNCVFVFMSHSSSVNDTLVESENPEDEENEDPEDTEGRASRLWVDRFSPRHYTELLSDDVSDVQCFCVTLRRKAYSKVFVEAAC